MSAPKFPPGTFSNLGPFEPVTMEALQRAHDLIMKHLDSRATFVVRDREPVPPWVADLLRSEDP